MTQIYPFNFKICKECKNCKSLSDFYKHSAAKDGYFNICKDCKKSYQSKREKILRKFDTEFVEKERKRGRDKYERLNYSVIKPKIEVKSKSNFVYNNSFPEKREAHRAVQHFPKKKGYNLHHWSYNIEHQKDIIELSTKNHYLIHRYLLYDKQLKMYKTKEGVLLSTKSEHLNYISFILDTHVKKGP